MFEWLSMNIEGNHLHRLHRLTEVVCRVPAPRFSLFFFSQYLPLTGLGKEGKKVAVAFIFSSLTDSCSKSVKLISTLLSE